MRTHQAFLWGQAKPAGVAHAISPDVCCGHPGLCSFGGNLASPSFVVMTSSDRQKSCGQLFFDYYWGSGFLPSRYQGVRFRNTGDPVPYVANPPGVSAASRRALLDDLAAINRAHLADYGDPEIDTRIAAYEMAYKMQASVPGLVDFSDEPRHVLDRYGTDVHVQGSYAYNCLVARRLRGGIDGEVEEFLRVAVQVVEFLDTVFGQIAGVFEATIAQHAGR